MSAATEDVSQLNGLWNGISTAWDPSKHPTRWAFYMECSKQSNGTATLHGNGSSSWKEHIIPFHFDGILNLRDWTFHLTKTHTGAVIKNSVEYTGTISLSNRSIEGDYKGGSLKLSQLEFQRNVDVDSLGAILHRRFVVATTMTGLWDGQSVRQQSSEATNWSDCNLIFDVAGNITGQGVSVWRSENIPFEVSGSFDAQTLKAQLIKSHLGKFSNRLVYDVDLDLDRLTASGTYASGTIELRKREAGHVPAVLPDNSSSSSARTALNRAPSKTAAALSPRRSQAQYASVSAGSIASPRGNANLSRQPSASSSRTYEELPPRLSNLSVSSGRPSSVVPDSKTSQQALPSELESYKIFLEALIASKKILPSQDDILQKYREDHKISSSQHALVLQRLGLTLSQFDAMRSKDARSEDANLCVICCDRPKDCLLLPCKHLACCFECVEEIISREHPPKCPVCRRAIVDKTKIFHS